MRTFRGLVAALGLVAFVSFLAQPVADAAQSGQAPPAQTQKAEVAKGELKAVDAAKRMLTITSGQTDQVFQYRRKHQGDGRAGRSRGARDDVGTTGHSAVHDQGRRSHSHGDRNRRQVSWARGR